MSREEVKPVKRLESDAEKDKFISEAESVVKKINHSLFSDEISHFTTLYGTYTSDLFVDIRAAIDRQSESGRVELIRGIKEMMKLNADNTLTLTLFFSLFIDYHHS